MSNEELSAQKIRNAIKKLCPSANDHDAVMNGLVLKVREYTRVHGNSFEAAMAVLAPELLDLEAKFKAAR